MTAPLVKRATISADGLYRYTLSRTWDWNGPVWSLAFIMLNPSTADAELDDPTIRRCMGFARTFGYGGLVVVNLYAFRATKPADLWRAADPVGPENDEYLAALLADRAAHGVPTIAAWGAHAKPDRVRQVLDMPGAERLVCLGHTKHGAPRHPLYLRGDSQMRPLTGGAS